MLGFYPSIDPEEFAIACAAFEERCHDSLDGTSWLSVKWTGQDLQIRQTRPLLHDNLAGQAVDDVRASIADTEHQVIESVVEEHEDHEVVVSCS